MADASHTVTRRYTGPVNTTPCGTGCFQNFFYAFPPTGELPTSIQVLDDSDRPVFFFACQDANEDHMICGATPEPAVSGCGSASLAGFQRDGTIHVGVLLLYGKDSSYVTGPLLTHPTCVGGLKAGTLSPLTGTISITYGL